MKFLFFVFLFFVPNIACAVDPPPWWDTAPGGAVVTPTGSDRLPLEQSEFGYTITIDKILSVGNFESSTSNDFDPDRLLGDSTDDNLIDDALIPSTIARDTELAITATGFNGNLAVTDDTPQEVAQKFDDYVPVYTDLDFTGTTGLSDGVDNTGLPTGIILYSDYANFAAFDTACTSGVWAYGDVGDTWTGQTGTLDCVFQPLPGSIYTDGGGNNIHIEEIKSGQDQQIFEGFASGLTIGLNTPDLFLNWWGPEKDGTSDDQPETQAMFTASQSGHRLWWPVESNIAMGQSATSSKSLQLYGRGSTIKVIDGWEDVGNRWLIGLRADQTDTSTGESISVTAKTNYFTKPASMTVSVGDFVKVYDSLTNHSTDSGGQYWGMQGVVVAIDGTTVYLSSPSDYSLTADTFFVYDTVKEPVIDGFTFDATAMTTTLAYNRIIEVLAAYNPQIRNNYFFGSDYSSEAVAIHGSHGQIQNNLCAGFLDVDGLEVGATTGRQGYCYVMDGNEHVANHNISINAKHHYVLGGTPISTRNIATENLIINDIADQQSIVLAHTGTPSVVKYQSTIDSHANNHTVIFDGNTVITGSGDAIFNVRGVEGKIRNNDVYIGNSSLTSGFSPIVWWKDTDTGFDRTVYFSGNEVINNATDWNYFLHTSTTSYPGMNFYLDTDNVFDGSEAVDFTYKPPCDSDYVGRFWYTQGSTSEHEVCMQTGSSTYAWRDTGLPQNTSSTTQVLYNDSGVISGAANMTYSTDGSGFPYLSISNDNPILFDLYTASSTNIADSGRINFVKAGGSRAAPTAVTDGMFLGTINVRGAYGAGTWDSNRTAMQLIASENWSSTAAGFRWEFKSRQNSAGSVGGTTVRLTIPDDGGIDIAGSTEPTCDSSNRGQIVFTEGGAGVADTLRVCRKDASDVYAWVALY